jgi:hypothetical protein
VKGVGARTALFGVLQAKSIDGKQMRLPEGKIAILALKHGVEHGPASLKAVEQDCAATTAGRRRIGWGCERADGWRFVHLRERRTRNPKKTTWESVSIGDSRSSGNREDGAGGRTAMKLAAALALGGSAIARK